MSNSRNKNKFIDHALDYEEYVNEVLSKIKLRCARCGSTKWDQAKVDVDSMTIEGCTDCCKRNKYGNLKPIVDA